MKILTLELENICGYRKATFNFDSQLSMLYGPNGCGKSNLLNIIGILCSPRRYAGRDFSLHFRKMVLHEDYDPAYTSFSWDGFVGVMRAVATFDIDGEKRQVVLEVDPRKARELEALSQDPSKISEYSALVDQIGVIKNELPPTQIDNAFFCNADNPSHMSKFQINQEAAATFLDITNAVFGYECFLEKEVEEYDSQAKGYVKFFTDFVMVKNDDGPDCKPVRVHYRRMSDGEKKIATLFKQMCTPSQYNTYDIFLIDNIELHAYFKRHKLLVDKIMQYFGNKQTIATTHSAVLVGMDDIPAYLAPRHLFDVIEVRKRG